LAFLPFTVASNLKGFQVTERNTKRIDTLPICAEIAKLAKLLLAEHDDGERLMAEWQAGKKAIRFGMDERQRVISLGFTDNHGRTETVDAIYTVGHEAEGRRVFDVVAETAGLGAPAGQH
jgi:hypothetical protein